MHGGGFAFGAPALDDTVNAKICSDWNVLVVSLDYPKAPMSQYPVPIQQVVTTILSILDDDSLPIDPSRVAIGGYSAGGQLALGACQDPKLKAKIKAVATFFPPTDFTIGAAEKKNTRSYRDKDDKDKLLPMLGMLQYGYVPVGQDLGAPGLSPSFAAREELPEWICTLAAERDVLANEAGAMMGRLAGKELVKVGGSEGLSGPDRNGFEADGGRLKWMLVKNAKHGFGGQNPEKTENESDEAVRVVGEWLYNGPFKAEK